MNLHMNIWIVVDKHILKLIYEPNIIFLVVDNIFLLDNAHKLIYDLVDNAHKLIYDLVDNAHKLIYDPMATATATATGTGNSNSNINSNGNS